MIKGAVIKLNELDLLIAQKLSEAYCRNSAEGRAKDKRIDDKRSSGGVSLQGLRGEIACAKMHNVYPDTSYETQKGGHDLTINGWKIDVKTTDGRLLIAPSHKKVADSDIYILMIDRFPEFEYQGWCFNHELLKSSNQNKEKYTRIGIRKDTYVIEPYEIHGYDIPERKNYEQSVSS